MKIATIPTLQKENPVLLGSQDREIQGQAHLAGGLLMYRAIASALAFQIVCTDSEKQANRYVLSVEAAETAAMNELFKMDAFTRAELENSLRIFRLYSLQNNFIVRNGRMVPLPQNLLKAKIKLQNIIRFLKPVLDPSYFVTFDDEPEQDKPFNTIQPP